MRHLSDRIERATGRRPVGYAPMSGGCIAQVHRVSMPGGGFLVAKVGTSAGNLDTEAYMLGLLKERSALPVPGVVHAEPDLLLIEFVEGSSRFSPRAQRHAADLLADLHGRPGERFGLERDTRIGSLPQPNRPNERWTEFFRDLRLLHMADESARAGAISPVARRRIDALARRIGEVIDEPEYPSLLHGDVWSGNVLAAGDRVTAFLDPAVYYGHAEIELAFITLFSTFGPPFFERYACSRPIRPGFFETRCHVYNLYPLLVHARLFGGNYGSRVEDTLEAIGF
ncbi:MAG: fructosamine kinase family protein [Phycisphaeraceae bacterium]|nr:fructosamine kinase family protein [Phycisphaerae bacterium]MBX3392699.1 fructosamine kinase family protein [Phycisphaeraceae bacterium]HRJ50210.1 fructosamine kinase family protein [Phycisphaerales bacterium]